MALKPVTFDFDAARRAYSADVAPIDVSFIFAGERYRLVAEPLLGDTFDVLDAPEHEIGVNDLSSIRVCGRFIRAMIEPGQREQWDDAVRLLPMSQARALIELLEWITRQVTTFPTLPPADSSVGRQANGRTSSKHTARTA